MKAAGTTNHHADAPHVNSMAPFHPEDDLWRTILRRHGRPHVFITNYGLSQVAEIQDADGFSEMTSSIDCPVSGVLARAHVTTELVFFHFRKQPLILDALEYVASMDV